MSIQNPPITYAQILAALASAPIADAAAALGVSVEWLRLVAATDAARSKGQS